MGHRDKEEHCNSHDMEGYRRPEGCLVAEFLSEYAAQKYADAHTQIPGSEQGGVRPVVILQNDIGNRYSPTTIVAPMTTQRKTYVPMHVKLKEDFLAKNSILLLEQIRTIDKRRLLSKMGSISLESQDQIDKVLDKNFYI